MDELDTALEGRKNELLNLSPLTFSGLKVWHSRTRPLIAQHYDNQIGAFDKHLEIKFVQPNLTRAIPALPDRARDAKRQQLISEREEAANRANDSKVSKAREQLLAHLEGLLSLAPAKQAEEDSSESASIFAEIIQIVTTSTLSSEWQSCIIGDINEAKRGYRGASFKGSVVLLGAALEGVMLGTLQRPVSYTHLTLPTTPYV